MTLLLETAEGVRPLSAESDGPIVAVIDGADVALHRLFLSESNPKARLGEARMRAIDLVAQPIEDLHLAVGPPDSEGMSWVALIDRERMAQHLAHFDAANAPPSHVVPAPLLLPEGQDQGALDGRLLIRGQTLAASVEPSLAPFILPETLPRPGEGPAPSTQPVDALPPADAALAIPATGLPVDLLQGEFEPRVDWWRQRRFWWIAGPLALLVAILAATPFVAEQLKGRATIAGFDRATLQVAENALPTAPADAQAAANALAAARRTAEAGAIGPRLSFAVAVVTAIPDARLNSLRLAPDSKLALSLGGPAEAVNATRERLLSGPFLAEGAGTDVQLGERRAATAATTSQVSSALLRFVTARQDAAVVATTPRLPRMPAAAVEKALADAGFAPEASSEGIAIPAARASSLLSLLADLELRGARYSQLMLSPNPDSTLSATVKVTG